MDCSVENEEIVEMRASEYQDRGLRVFLNAWKNSDQFPLSSQGSSLQGTCAGKVAVVCGAGVSLEGVIPLLADLKDRALVIAGGSAIAALHRNGVAPHFMTGVDPDPSFERFLEQKGFDSPFVYQSRFSSEQLSLLLGKKVWMPGSGTCCLDARLLGIEEPFDAGWSVANFSVAFATLLGCSTIVLSGMDFCAPKKKLYASNLRFTPEEELMIPVPGTSYHTRRDWLLSQEWLLQWMKRHPEVQWRRTDTLDPVLASHVKEVSAEGLYALPSSDLSAEVHALLQEASLIPVTDSLVQEYKARMQKSVQTALHLCNRMLSIWEKGHPKLPFNLPEYVLCKSDLEGEIAYEDILFPVWQVWKIPVLKEESHEAGKKLHELLFFKTTLETYLAEMS